MMKKSSAWWICFWMMCLSGLHAQTLTMVHDGIERSYELHIPSSYTGASPAPLVIGFHPYGSSGFYFQSMTLFNRISDEEGFIVAFPNATGTPSEWNVGMGLTPETLLVDDIGFISALIDLLLMEYNIDPNRVYTVGFSNGSIMSHRVAADLSGKVTAIGAVAGQGTTAMMENLQPDRPVGIIHIHMLNDTSLYFIGGEVNGVPYPSVMDYLNVWVEKNGCLTNSDIFEGDDGYQGLIWESTGSYGDVVLYRLDSGGHSWPHITISATDKIWAFFESQVAGDDTDVMDRNIGEVPVDFYLFSNYPNPFNPETTILFTLPKAEHVRLTVYSLRGEVINELVNGPQSAGEHRIVWKGRDAQGRSVSSGIYLYKIQTETHTETRKMLLVR